MSTRPVQTKCKICKKDLVVQIDDDYFGNLEPLLAMATCNHCYDLRDKHLRATKNIQNLCTWLVQHPKANHDARKEVQNEMEHWTKEYAQAIQQFNHASKVVWSTDFAQILMDKPENWYEALRVYRQQVREHAQLAGISS